MKKEGGAFAAVELCRRFHFAHEFDFVHVTRYAGGTRGGEIEWRVRPSAALKGRNDVVSLLVDRGAKLDQRDHGSRDTHTAASLLAGHTWQAIDYADGLVRVGVQSAVSHPDTATLIRKLMMDRGMTVPPPNRVVDSICVVELCAERTWK